MFLLLLVFVGYVFSCKCVHGKKDPKTESCICDAMWEGECCDKKIPPANCCDHGMMNTAGYCMCYSGWSGICCDHDDSCGHGTPNPYGGGCECEVEWTGKHCDIHIPV